MTECSEAYQHLYDTCLCPRSRLISGHLLDVFIIKSGDTDQVESKGSHFRRFKRYTIIKCIYFNSSRYFLIHLKHFNLSWTYFLYPLSQVSTHVINLFPPAPSEFSSALWNAEQTQRSKYCKWVKTYLWSPNIVVYMTQIWIISEC